VILFNHEMIEPISRRLRDATKGDKAAIAIVRKLVRNNMTSRRRHDYGEGRGSRHASATQGVRGRTRRGAHATTALAARRYQQARTRSRK